LRGGSNYYFIIQATVVCQLCESELPENLRRG